jgi:hypothetical protein
VKGRLRPGLDDVLSAPTAWPAKRPAQGPHHQAVGTDIHAAQRGARQSEDDSVDKTLHYMSGDATAPGCGRTGGDTEARRNRRVDSSVTWNSPAMTRGVGAREDWGKKAPDRRVPTGND